MKLANTKQVELRQIIPIKQHTCRKQKGDPPPYLARLTHTVVQQFTYECILLVPLSLPCFTNQVPLPSLLPPLLGIGIPHGYIEWPITLRLSTRAGDAPREDCFGVRACISSETSTVRLDCRGEWHEHRIQAIAPIRPQCLLYNGGEQSTSGHKAELWSDAPCPSPLLPEPVAPPPPIIAPHGYRERLR